MIRANAPAGWKVKKLSDCLEKLIDYRGKSTPKDSFGYQLITARNVRFGYIKFEPKEYMNPTDYKDWMTRGFPEPNDVLFTTEAPLGNVALYPSEGTYALAQRLVTLRPFKDELNSVYLFYYLLSDYAQNQVRIRATGSTAKGIRQSELRKVPVFFPPLPEQHKIAEIISTWDKAIAKTEQLIAALQERKKGLMQRLLTGEVRFPGFDGEWEEKSVSQMGQILNGGTPSTSKAEYWNGDIAWTTPTDITSLSTRYIDRTKRNITDEGLKNSSATLIRPNSILVCTRATIGESAINRIPMATNQGFKNLIPNSEFDTEFLYYLLHFHKNQLVRYANGSTFLELSKKDFSRLRFLVPSKKEQEHVSRVLNNCDKEIELHHEKLASLQQQKKGLMQRLLTGQVRVKV